MSEAATNYPLSWPLGWRRTPSGSRRYSRFARERVVATTVGSYRSKAELTVAQAVDRLLPELDRLGARDVVVSTNVKVKRDGFPYSDAREPEDPGVAVYFKIKGAPRVIACDSFTKVAGNLAAIAATIGALRAVDRYGAVRAEQVFAGFTALPAMERSWREVLGIPPNQVLDEGAVRARYRELAKRAHPDAGGSDEQMSRLNQALKDALMEVSR